MEGKHLHQLAEYDASSALEVERAVVPRVIPPALPSGRRAHLATGGVIMVCGMNLKYQTCYFTFLNSSGASAADPRPPNAASK